MGEFAGAGMRWAIPVTTKRDPPQVSGALLACLQVFVALCGTRPFNTEPEHE